MAELTAPMMQRWYPERLGEAIRQAANSPVWLVGGAVRDRLLQRSTSDYDFIVDGSARELARRVADKLHGAYFDLDAERDVGRVIIRRGQPYMADFAAMQGGSLSADLLLRDFTINAIALPLDAEDQWVDPGGGLRDLKDRLLRVCDQRAIERDPLRALRAVRFAVLLNMRIDPPTIKLLAGAAKQLSGVSAERLRDEFFHLLDLPRPAQALRVLNHQDLLRPILPWLYLPAGKAGDAEGPLHSIAIVDRLTGLLGVLGPVHDPAAASEMQLAEVVLRLGRFRQQIDEHGAAVLAAQRTRRALMVVAALSRGISSEGRSGAEASELRQQGSLAAWGRAMRLSKTEITHLQQVQAAEAPADQLLDGRIDGRTIYRYFRQTGPGGIDQLLIALAARMIGWQAGPAQELWAVTVEHAREVISAYFDDDRQRIQPPQLVDGVDLGEQFELAPGRQIGDLLEAIREAQAAGEIETRQQALDLVRSLLDNLPPAVRGKEA